LSDQTVAVGDADDEAREEDESLRVLDPAQPVMVEGSDKGLTVSREMRHCHHRKKEASLAIDWRNPHA